MTDETEDSENWGEQRKRKELPHLNAFAALQRQLVGLDFSALTAAQHAISKATVANVAQIAASQNAIAQQFAGTLNLARIGDSYQNLVKSTGIAEAIALRTQWADSLICSTNFAALTDAFTSTRAMADLTGANLLAASMSMGQQAEVFAGITKALEFSLPAIDMAALSDSLDRWIPVNLRDADDLGAAAAIALDEGIPVSWIPCSAIVVALIAAPDAEARLVILDSQRAMIVDDCEEALAPLSNEWANQCRIAVATLRAGSPLDAAAQSHASNIIDSIVLALFTGKDGRKQATAQAQADVDDLPLQLVAENITLRPLLRAFTAWWPNTGSDPPEYFARHATAHAIGYVGVFSSRSAVIAVMLATSLAVQYAHHSP